MRKKLLIGLALVLIIALGVWSFPILKKRYFSPSPTSDLSIKQKTENKNNPTNPTLTPSNDNSNPSSTETTASPTDTVSDESADNSEAEDSKTTPEESFLDVTTKNCDNQCKDFNDPEDFKYCQNVCGLIPIPKEEIIKTTKCELIEDSLEADYCFKNQAISKNDIKICKNILDTNIKKTCTNRFLEDILDQVPKE